jgi:5-amino-6-(5-phosphoribosylamino)uracil reductase
MSEADHLAWARARVARLLAVGPGERVIAPIVMSRDHVAAVGGTSARLASDADRALLRAWREVADALLVGPGTLMAERYGASLVGEDARRRRAERGQPPLPPVLTLDRTGSLDLDLALRARDPLRLVVYARTARDDPRAEWVELAEPTLDRVLDAARAPVVVLEAGPRLLGAALAAGVVTDLSLTIAPLTIGDGPRYSPSLWADAPIVEPDEIGGDLFRHHLIRATRRRA